VIYLPGGLSCPTRQGRPRVPYEVERVVRWAEGASVAGQRGWGGGKPGQWRSRARKKDGDTVEETLADLADMRAE